MFSKVVGLCTLNGYCCFKYECGNPFAKSCSLFSLGLGCLLLPYGFALGWMRTVLVVGTCTVVA